MRESLSCCKLFDIQWRSGRYFLHEHPDGAGSWLEQCIKKLLNKHGVVRTTGDQCMYGLTTKAKGKNKKVPAKKPTKFMTNIAWIAN